MDMEEEFQRRLLNRALIKYSSAYEKSADGTKVFVSSFQCPRCGNYMPNDYGLAAVSRISEGVIQIFICGQCGQEESQESIPITEWEIAKRMNEK